MALLAATGADSAAVEGFPLLGSRVNCVRSVAGSLWCVSSVINSYASFLSLLCRPSFTHTENTVLLWGATFRPGATFRNYLCRLKKACFLTGAAIDWYTPAVRDASKGLRCAFRRPFKFPNFIYTQDLFKIINGIGWEDHFALIACAYFLFILRVPSEAM